MLSQRARKILGADPEVEQARNELLDILDGLVLAAQANGSLRPDVSSGDLGVILSIVLQGVHSAPDDIRSEAPARYLTLMLDGLQARPGTPLPGRPVTAADIAVVRGAQR